MCEEAERGMEVEKMLGGKENGDLIEKVEEQRGRNEKYIFYKDGYNRVNCY